SSPGARSTDPAGVTPPSLVAAMGSEGGGGGGGLLQAASTRATRGRMRSKWAFTLGYLAFLLTFLASMEPAATASKRRRRRDPARSRRLTHRLSVWST